jgi:nucleotide-binding universal stress UspA family protein
MVPLDGSPLSQQALSIGVSIARQERAELHVITVVAPLAHDSIVEGALHDGYRRYLSVQAEAVGRLEPEVTLVHRVLDGGVVDALARYARDEDIDLIVMTTHGWGRLKRLWLGSVAQDVVHRVHCPVLLMRRAGEPQAFGLHRILVALESAEDAEVLLEPALSLGSLVEGAQYTLLQVVQLEPTLILRLAGIPDRSVRDWVGQIADEATCRLRTGGPAECDPR